MFKSQSNSPHPSEIVCTFPKPFKLPTSCRLSDMKSFFRSTRGFNSYPSTCLRLVHGWPYIYTAQVSLHSCTVKASPDSFPYTAEVTGSLSEAARTLPSGFHPSITSHVCGALNWLPLLSFSAPEQLEGHRDLSLPYPTDTFLTSSSSLLYGAVHACLLSSLLYLQSPNHFFQQRDLVLHLEASSCPQSPTVGYLLWRSLGELLHNPVLKTLPWC